jgi:hypothetical protein
MTMQVLSAEQLMPMPLTCSGCRHWTPAGTQTLADTDRSGTATGRCGRFAETRAGTARPRCNICWEPAAIGQSIMEGTTADD